MKELEYCEQKCGKLSEAQKKMVLHHVKKGSFVGVGRAMCRSVYFPLISLSGDGKNLNVVNGAGHYDSVAIESATRYI